MDKPILQSLERKVNLKIDPKKAEYDHNRYMENRDQVLARSKAHRLANPEKVAEYQKAYRAKHAERIAAQKAEWYQRQKIKSVLKNKTALTKN